VVSGHVAPPQTRQSVPLVQGSPEVIRLAVLMYVRFLLSLRNVEDLLFERGIHLCHETVRLWWNRFGRIFAAEVPAAAGRPDARDPALALAS